MPVDSRSPQPGVRHGSVPRVADRVSTAVRFGGGVRPLSGRPALARRVRVPVLPEPPQLGPQDEAGHLRVRQLRAPDLGDRGHYPPYQIRHASKLPLTVWFLAAYFMATDTNGLSARQLQSRLGLGSYRTAWMLAAKLGRAMVAPDRRPLAGLAEVDETSLPLRTTDDPPAGGVGRSHHGKRLVVGAIEVTDGKPGRLRLQAIADYSAQTLHAFVVQALAAGSIAKTDGWVGYPGAPGVTHDPHVVGPMAAHVILPWIHTVFANLKTWAKGVYHGLHGPHLQTYLDEFVFRFNRRRTPHAAFRSVLTIAAAVHPVPYKML